MALAARAEQPQSEIQVLRGDTEALTFRTDGSGERQLDLYLDIDGCLQALESVRARLEISIDERVAEEEAPPPPVLLPGSDQDHYQAAFNLLRDGNYGESASAFEQFLDVFPSSPLADNAYWLAETRHGQRQYTVALRALQLLVEEYPASGKLPDALLTIGFFATMNCSRGTLPGNRCREWFGNFPRPRRRGWRPGVLSASLENRVECGRAVRWPDLDRGSAAPHRNLFFDPGRCPVQRPHRLRSGRWQLRSRLRIRQDRIRLGRHAEHVRCRGPCTLCIGVGAVGAGGRI